MSIRESPKWTLPKWIDSFTAMFACIMGDKYFYVIQLTNSQCFHPEIKQINFYSENDRYFGHFLRDTCYNSRSICMKFALFFLFPILSSPKCQKPLYQHQIIILHNGFQLTISSSIVGNARHQSDVIRTWRFAFLLLLIYNNPVDANAAKKRSPKWSATKFSSCPSESFCSWFSTIRIVKVRVDTAYFTIESHLNGLALW